MGVDDIEDFILIVGLVSLVFVGFGSSWCGVFWCLC